MRLVFMGTPDFALPSLKALTSSGHTLAAVVTQPDSPQGRGQHLFPPPVKMEAEAAGIKVLQPQKLKDPAFLDELGRLSPDLIVVVAFGRILRPEVLQLPRLGCMNVHASLLPKYRGAAPIAWAIIKGEKQTGVTTFKMDEGMDTGDIYLQEVVEIAPSDTAGGRGGGRGDPGASTRQREADVSKRVCRGPSSGGRGCLGRVGLIIIFLKDRIRR